MGSRDVTWQPPGATNLAENGKADNLYLSAPRNLSLPPSRTRLTMSLLLAFIATAAVLLALDLLTAPKHRETSSALKDGRRAA